MSTHFANVLEKVVEHLHEAETLIPKEHIVCIYL